MHTHALHLRTFHKTRGARVGGVVTCSPHDLSPRGSGPPIRQVALDRVRKEYRVCSRPHPIMLRFTQSMHACSTKAKLASTMDTRTYTQELLHYTPACNSRQKNSAYLVGQRQWHCEGSSGAAPARLRHPAAPRRPVQVQAACHVHAYAEMWRMTCDMRGLAAC